MQQHIQKNKVVSVRQYLRDKFKAKNFISKQNSYRLPVRAKQRKEKYLQNQTKNNTVNNDNKIHFEAFHRKRPILTKIVKWMINLTVSFLKPKCKQSFFGTKKKKLPSSKFLETVYANRCLSNWLKTDGLTTFLSRKKGMGLIDSARD